MKRNRLSLIFVLFFSAIMVISCSQDPDKARRKLAQRILKDPLLEKVDSMARVIVRQGFTAGDGYGEVWIRDLNTFIELSCQVVDPKLIRESLVTFFQFQGPTGDIVDGFLPIEKAQVSDSGYQYRYSELNPRYAAHKNTVETDQESALVQAVYKYVKGSKDYAFLDEVIDGKTVLERMDFAMSWLMAERFSPTYGLLWGATTADWGDVQPEHSWGVALDDDSHLAIDIYDNAMFLVALERLQEFVVPTVKDKWLTVNKMIRKNVMEHLWDEENQKFIPHIYIDGSPFPADFDENQIFYHGGTTVAIEAGLLSSDQIIASYKKMVENVEKSGAHSIGLTLYPAYPEGFFKNKGMGPYSYQNGGDWTWFGGRTVSALVDNWLIVQGYESLRPMLKRVVKNGGFYEWYTIDNIPSGSGTFRGEAGVLSTAIKKMRDWAHSVK